MSTTWSVKLTPRHRVNCHVLLVWEQCVISPFYMSSFSLDCCKVTVVVTLETLIPLHILTKKKTIFLTLLSPAPYFWNSNNNNDAVFGLTTFPMYVPRACMLVQNANCIMPINSMYMTLCCTQQTSDEYFTYMTERRGDDGDKKVYFWFKFDTYFHSILFSAIVRDNILLTCPTLPISKDLCVTPKIHLFYSWN